MVAYFAEVEKDEEWEYVLIVGSRVVSVPEGTSRVFLNHDGTKVGTIERVGEDDDRQYRVVVGQTKGKLYDQVGTPEFGGPEGTVVYQADKGSRSLVVVGDREFDAPGIVGEPVMTANGSQVGYGAKLGRELWWKVIELK